MFLRRLVYPTRARREEEEQQMSAAETAELLVPVPPPLPQAPDPIGLRICGDVVSRCEAWVAENWSTPSSPILDVRLNPAVMNRSPAYVKFKAALVRHGIDLACEDAYTFGWHGSAEANIPQICYHGFDPDLRKGQQYGPGEYFGWSSSTSVGYCRDGNLLLVCVVLKGHWTSQQPGTAIICLNPPNCEGATYCLPLLVVNFGAHREVSFVLHPNTASNKQYTRL